jgi:hypothetical protein
MTPQFLWRISGGLLLLVLAVLLLVQRQTMSRVQEENSQLIAQVQQDQLRATNSIPHPVDPDELSRQSSERAELLKLRGLAAQARQDADELQRLRAEHDANQAGGKRGPEFSYPYLPRSAWTNAGMQSPFKAVQTFLWAFSNTNQAALAQASVKSTNDWIKRLAGLESDLDPRLTGVQLLSVVGSNADLNQRLCVVLTESRTATSVYHKVHHWLLKREDGQWRFDHRVD